MFSNSRFSRMQTVSAVTTISVNKGAVLFLCIFSSHDVADCFNRFSFVDGKCVRRVEEHRTPVECPPHGVNESQTLVERGDCDKTSCLRKVRQSRWVLDGCRCHQMTNESTEACCCDQYQPQVKEICRSDGTILKVGLNSVHT